MKLRYSILIEWSDEDECYVVSLPEWGSHCHTHGNSYQEAFKNALEVLELLVDSTQQEGKPLPKPKVFGETLQVA